MPRRGREWTNEFEWRPRRRQCDWMVPNRAGSAVHFCIFWVEVGQRDPSADTFQQLPARNCSDQQNCNASWVDTLPGRSGTRLEPERAVERFLHPNPAWRSKRPIQQSNSYIRAGNLKKRGWVKFERKSDVLLLTQLLWTRRKRAAPLPRRRRSECGRSRTDTRPALSNWAGLWRRSSTYGLWAPAAYCQRRSYRPGPHGSKRPCRSCWPQRPPLGKRRRQTGPLPPIPQTGHHRSAIWRWTASWKMNSNVLSFAGGRHCCQPMWKRTNFKKAAGRWDDHVLAGKVRRRTDEQIGRACRSARQLTAHVTVRAVRTPITSIK